MSDPATAAAEAVRFVAYLRVSTDKQGLRGLGVDAQRNAVAEYVRRAGPGACRLAEYVEVESGRRSDRPELAKALAHARNAGATLVIAKLDRLSRDAHFLLGLHKAGVEFVACDLPSANRLTLTIMAAVAEHEREMISQRTKAALAAAKRRGVRLGNPNGAKHLLGRGNAEAVAMVKARADETAERLSGELDAIREMGIVSARGIAKALNARGIRSPRGGTWDAKAVTRVLSRLGQITTPNDSNRLQDGEMYV